MTRALAMLFLLLPVAGAAVAQEAAGAPPAAFHLFDRLPQTWQVEPLRQEVTATEHPQANRQLPEPQEAAAESEAQAADAAPRLVAATWCPVRSGEPVEGDVGCDAGLGAALYRKGRIFIAAVVGGKSVGGGLGWTAGKAGPVVVAVALGVVAPYDESGIDVGRASLAIGCTAGLGGGR